MAVGTCARLRSKLHLLWSQCFLLSLQKYVVCLNEIFALAHRFVLVHSWHIKALLWWVTVPAQVTTNQALDGTNTLVLWHPHASYIWQKQSKWWVEKRASNENWHSMQFKTHITPIPCGCAKNIKLKEWQLVSIVSFESYLKYIEWSWWESCLPACQRWPHSCQKWPHCVQGFLAQWCLESWGPLVNSQIYHLALSLELHTNYSLVFGVMACGK